MKNTQQVPLWLQRLWQIWFGMIAVLFLVRFIFLNGADENVRFFVFAPFMILSWLPLMFINMYVALRFENYLRKHHQAQRHIWGGFGPVRAIRKVRFLRSTDDLGDAEVGRLKREYRALLKLMTVIFWTLPFLFIAFMLGAKTN